MADKPTESPKDRLFRDIENGDLNDFLTTLPSVPAQDLHTPVATFISMLAAATAANNHPMVEAILAAENWTAQERLDARQTAVSHAFLEDYDIIGYQDVFALLGQIQPEHVASSAAVTTAHC